MNLLLLPGNSKQNKVWIDGVESELKSSFDNTMVHYYDHWWSEDPDAIIDMEIELNRLDSTTESFGKYALFAKSAGALLALYGIYEGTLTPEVCVFVGTAINWGRKEGFEVDDWLANYSIPTLFIQKSFDPAISARGLSDLLQDREVQNYSLLEIPGDDHTYSDIVAKII
jgi:hypothetical protein